MPKQSDRAQRIDALRELLAEPRPKSVLEKLAIERQLRDLDSPPEGLVWNEDEAARCINLFSKMRHWKGEMAGQPFVLRPFQEQLHIAPLFGWYRADGRRRFTQGYIEMPRKNGKTTELAGIGIQGLVADNEPGAEVCSAATKREQAAIVFNDAKRMIRSSPLLNSVCTIHKYSITCGRWDSSFQPLASDAKKLDGYNLHRVLCDEVHEYPDRSLWDVLIEATAARKNPLQIGITTAGHDRSSICWELHEYVRNILEGNYQDDSFFGYIACADPDDPWDDPEVWAKANPNYGISVQPEYFEQMARQAKVSPSKENTFRRKHLNQWTEQAVRWIPMHAWDACERAFELEDLKGRECYAGLDLASNRDVNALALVFPEPHGEYKTFCFYWVPEQVISERGQQDRRQVMNWAAKGLINTTSGNTTDYAAIVEFLMGLLDSFQIIELAYDPWHAAAVVQMLENAGFPFEALVEFRQTIGNYAAPSKEFETLIFAEKLHHNGDPVLRWMVGNAAAHKNANDDIRPDKEKSADKIDGVVATIMALARTMGTEQSAGLLLL